MRISVTFSTARSPSEAFGFIAQDFFKNHQKWDPDLISNVKLSDGPIGVGTRGRSVTKFAGKQTADFEVTEFELNKSFVFVNTSGAVALERSYFFKPNRSGGTDINFVFDMNPRRLDTKLAFPVLGAITRKKVNKNIETLRSLLDSKK